MKHVVLLLRASACGFGLHSLYGKERACGPWMTKCQPPATGCRVFLNFYKFCCHFLFCNAVVLPLKQPENGLKAHLSEFSSLKIWRFRNKVLPLHPLLQANANMVPVVQLVRASDCGSECRGFESHRAPTKRHRRKAMSFLVRSPSGHPRKTSPCKSTTCRGFNSQPL